MSRWTSEQSQTRFRNEANQTPTKGTSCLLVLMRGLAYLNSQDGLYVLQSAVNGFVKKKNKTKSLLYSET